MGGPAPVIVPKLENLPFTTRTVHVVNVDDLEDFLAAKLGLPQVDIYNSDPEFEELSFNVDGNDLPVYDEEVLKNFIANGEIDADSTEISMALDYAASKGWIAPGNYIVDMS